MKAENEEKKRKIKEYKSLKRAAIQVLGDDQEEFRLFKKPSLKQDL